ncbi:ER degradation-enhancing alpha-mannosidase-like protein 2 isoform X2 [Hetaerina americana]|uniref:ER degradation-enhancing alpha-mannosidase-like protein 2 isoform X2 n=1 Tax=Hetaerina americana TaxID=62018 RepID=UPI003A7F5F87
MAGVNVEPGWPCNGPLLRLAEDVARRLLAAFDTATGMPYGTVNLRYGVPPGETSVTCTAGIGTFIVEFGTLSRLTGDPLYEEVALKAMNALRHHRSSIGLLGNHIDVQSGRWTALDAGIGAGVDSYYEYLAKGAVLLHRPELAATFAESRKAIFRYLRQNDWHFWVSMTRGEVALPIFQSLEAFWPGTLSLVGDIDKAMKSLHNYHRVWKQYGFTPEFYNIPQGEPGTNREGYPLRPELVESTMYLYRVTKDPYLLEVGADILSSIQHSSRTPCGYATIKDVKNHCKEDRMESFFLAETTKYLYLLFDPGNFLHDTGSSGTVISTPWGQCIVQAGGYVFNTEAHPIDPGALHCCSGTREAAVREQLQVQLAEGLDPGLPNPFQGTKLMERSDSKKRRRRKKAKANNNSQKDSEEKKLNTSEKNEHVGKGDATLDDEISTKASSSIEAVENNLERDEISYTKSDDKVNGDGIKRSIEGSSPVVDDDSLSWQQQKQTLTVPNETSMDSEGTEIEDEIPGDMTGGARRRIRIQPAEDKIIKKTEEEGPVGLVVPSSDTSPNFSGKIDAEKPVGPIRKESLSQSEWEVILQRGGGPRQPSTSAPTFISPSHTHNKYVQFDPQRLLERLRLDSRFELNATWLNDYSYLTCTAQPFIQRISVHGEFFEIS